MNGSSCGLVHGTEGTQMSMEQQELEQIAEQNEQKAIETYIHEVLPKLAPIEIPSDAKVISQVKKGYYQVKYQWCVDGYHYIGRWHTRTPNAPIEQGDSWVIERHRPGIGLGVQARPAIREVFIEKDKWIAKAEWDKAIRARKNGIATKEQKELLNHGHWNISE